MDLVTELVYMVYGKGKGLLPGCWLSGGITALRGHHIVEHLFLNDKWQNIIVFLHIKTIIINIAQVFVRGNANEYVKLSAKKQTKNPQPYFLSAEREIICWRCFYFFFSLSLSLDLACYYTVRGKAFPFVLPLYKLCTIETICIFILTSPTAVEDLILVFIVQTHFQWFWLHKSDQSSKFEKSIGIHTYKRERQSLQIFMSQSILF